MPRVGLLVATAGALVALTASTVIAAPAGAANPTSPPTVGAVQWTDAHAAAGTASNQLNNISCTSASFCVAVGEQNRRDRWRDARRSVERDHVEGRAER